MPLGMARTPRTCRPTDRRIRPDGRNYFDALAAHPGSAANHPDTKYPARPESGHCPPKPAAQEGKCWRDAPDFYFRRIEDQRAVMEEYGWSVLNGDGSNRPAFEVLRDLPK